MTYTATLQRLKEFDEVTAKGSTESATLGQLILTDEEDKILFECYTCENGGPSTDTPNQDKRIVAREYYLEWTDSGMCAKFAANYPKYKSKTAVSVLPWVKTKELKSFASRRILVHPGNYPQDTLGCLLLGDSANMQKGFISNSQAACYRFFEVLREIGIENVRLIIKEIGE